SFIEIPHLLPSGPHPRPVEWKALLQKNPAGYLPREVKPDCPLLAYELLGPIMSVFAALGITHPDVGKLGAQDVGTVSAAVHPPFHRRLRRWIAGGDIFTRSPVLDAKLAHHGRGRTVGGGIVGKI